MGEITVQDIQHRAKELAGNVVRTPCRYSRTLSEIAQAEVYLKFENLQFTGSFKDRGALAKLLSLNDQQGRQGVVAMSAGNHAQAVAYHAQRLGIPATIVMPRFTPNVKVEHTKEFGATVVLYGMDLEEAKIFTDTLVKEKSLTLIHPYDDETVIAGQGTVALEMLEDVPSLDLLLIPVGGGGLIAGCSVAAKGLKPDIQVVGVQTSRFAFMRQALQGLPCRDGGTTVAEGIGVKAPGQLTLPIVRKLVEDILLVEEREIEHSIQLLLEVEKTVVEGAGAVGLAVLLKDSSDRFKHKRVGVVLSGGNIDLTVLASVIQRGLVRSGRLVRLRVELPDRPGALAEITKVLSELDANIVEIIHHRSFTNVPLKSAEVEIVLETRGSDHLSHIVSALQSTPFTISLPNQPKS